MSRAEVLDILRGSDPVCVCAHASPDGDALGSLLGLGPSLAATGRDVVLYQDGDEPFPRELAFLGLERIARRVPADAARRTLIALDCGSALRIDRRGQVAGQFARVVNIDHHHDNTLFGAVNLVDPSASCTAEIVAGLLDEAGIALAEGAALALYVGLVTDTGRFQYANTTPSAHRLAARLLQEGVEPAPVFATLFESLPLARQRLLGLALGRAEVAGGGRLAMTWLGRDDFAATGADDAASDGVVDALRAIEGVELRRSCASRAIAPGRRARSRCAPAPTASTARRSRASAAAAGIPARPASRPTRRSGRSAPSWSGRSARERGGPARGQARWPDVVRLRRPCARRARRSPREGRARRDARSLRDWPAGAARGTRDAPGALPGRARQALPRGRPARDPLRHGGP